MSAAEAHWTSNHHAAPVSLVLLEVAGCDGSGERLRDCDPEGIFDDSRPDIPGKGVSCALE